MTAIESAPHLYNSIHLGLVWSGETIGPRRSIRSPPWTQSTRGHFKVARAPVWLRGYAAFPRGVRRRVDHWTVVIGIRFKCFRSDSSGCTSGPNHRLHKQTDVRGSRKPRMISANYHYKDNPRRLNNELSPTLVVFHFHRSRPKRPLDNSAGLVGGLGRLATNGSNPRRTSGATTGSLVSPDGRTLWRISSHPTCPFARFLTTARSSPPPARFSPCLALPIGMTGGGGGGGGSVDETGSIRTTTQFSFGASKRGGG